MNNCKQISLLYILKNLKCMYPTLKLFVVEVVAIVIVGSSSTSKWQ